MNPAIAWSEVRERRALEQEALRRAQVEALQQRMQVAVEERDTVARVRIEAEMQALANQQSQRYQNARQRDEAAARAQQQFVQAANEPWLKSNEPEAAMKRSRKRPPEPLTEGAPPAAAFESSLQLTQEVKARREQIQQSLTWMGESQAIAPEQARMDLGKAIDQAVVSGLFDDWRGLLLVALGGLNVEPIPVSDLRMLLSMLMVQAVQARMLPVARARMLAQMIMQGGDPDPTRPSTPDLEALRTRALEAVPLDGSPLTPTGLTEVGDALQALARAVPELVDRLARLEALVYEALQVLPCHQGHDLHLTTPVLCDEQAGDLARGLISGLGLSDRQLPRDVHRDADGERWSCCQKDGRLGTWLVYGQYTNPDLRSSAEAKETTP